MTKQEGSRRDSQPPARPQEGQGIRAPLLAWARDLPERLRRPESLLMVMAMLASLGAHMPPYMSLGALADYFKHHPSATPPPAPVEVSFVEDSPSATRPAPSAPWEAVKPARRSEERAKKPEPEPPKTAVAVPAPAVVPPPPSELQPRKQSVTQKSEDPNAEPPPDAKFLAEENRRVKEETLATVRDQARDAPDPTPSAPEPKGGSQEPAESSPAQPGQPQPRSEAQEERAVASRPAAEAPSSPSQPESAPRTPRAAGPALPAGTVIQDPLGSFVMAAVPQATPGRKGRASPSQTGQVSAPGEAAPNLKVSWRAFEETFGAEQLAKDRMPPGSKRRGAGREKRWSEFRAAIENYITGVKPGNTTALNAAADPFAAYLAAFHRNLHIEFAHEFLGSLPVVGKLADPNLVTKVEIVVNPDGTLDRVGIVKTSGDTMYDFGAFNAVQRGAPYPPTPEKIRSPDGRAYIQWALRRDESQCGTWNAEPYLLRTPPRSPSDPPEDHVPPFRKRSPLKEGQDNRAPKPAGEGGSVLPGEKWG